MMTPLERAAEGSTGRVSPRRPPRLPQRWRGVRVTVPVRCPSRARGPGGAAAPRAGAVLARGVRAGRGRRALGQGRHLSRGRDSRSRRGHPRTIWSGSTGRSARTGARRLVVLGDLFHARAGRVATRTLADLRRWREARRHAGDPARPRQPRPPRRRSAGGSPDQLRRRSGLPPAVRAPASARAVGGRLHPGGTRAPGHRPRAGAGLFRERLPCFVVGESVTVLPAFGSFTGLGMITPEPGERIFVVADGEVLPVGVNPAGPATRSDALAT